MDRPIVSVVMSVHNGQDFLRDAVDSILQQTFTDIELLVADDASTDATRDILAGYSDPRVRLFFNESNRGLTRNLNRLIHEARGAYIARMDHDDVSLPHRLARQVAFLDRNPEVGLIGAAAEVINAHGQGIGVVYKPENHGEIVAHFEHSNCIVHPTAMIRRSVLDQVGLYDENYRYAQDYDLWLRICEISRAHNLPEILLRYRVHAGQLSVGKVVEQCVYAHRSNLAARRRRLGIRKLTLQQRFRDSVFEWLGRPGSLASFYLGQLGNFGPLQTRQTPRELLRLSLVAAPLSRSAWRLFAEEIGATSIVLKLAQRKQFQTPRVENPTGYVRMLSKPDTEVAGGVYKIAVIIRNDGEEVWYGYGTNPVCLSYHWKNVDGQYEIFDGVRTELSNHIVRAGESVEEIIKVIAPNAHGEFSLILTLVQEGVCWFEGSGFIDAKILMVLRPG